SSRRRHTRWPRDWSSDVCSSDLVDAIHDRVAAEEPVRILQVVEALVRRLVAAVGDEAVGLQEPGGPHELVGVPPEARARRRAARSEERRVGKEWRGRWWRWDVED